jgi:hypothetical protein
MTLRSNMGGRMTMSMSRAGAMDSVQDSEDKNMWTFESPFWFKCPGHIAALSYHYHNMKGLDHK